MQVNRGAGTVSCGSRRGRRFGVLAVVAGLAMAVVPQALADTISISRRRPTPTSAPARPATSYGTGPSFDVYGGASVVWLRRPGPSEGLLKFDLSSIPAGAVVTSASLTLTSFAGLRVRRRPGPPCDLPLRRLLDGVDDVGTRPADGFSPGIPEPTINGVPLSSSPDNLGRRRRSTRRDATGRSPTAREFSSANLATRIATERAGDGQLSLAIVAPACGTPGAVVCQNGQPEPSALLPPLLLARGERARGAASGRHLRRPRRPSSSTRPATCRI